MKNMHSRIGNVPALSVMFRLWCPVLPKQGKHVKPLLDLCSQNGYSGAREPYKVSAKK